MVKITVCFNTIDLRIIIQRREGVQWATPLERAHLWDGWTRDLAFLSHDPKLTHKSRRVRWNVAGNSRPFLLPSTNFETQDEASSSAYIVFLME